MFIVTHNIEEAVLLGDRIVVLGKNPGRICTDFHVDLPRPRDRKHPRFTKIVHYIYQVPTKPDGDPALTRSGPAAGSNSPPPNIRCSRMPVPAVLRASSKLAHHNGREDVYRMADYPIFRYSLSFAHRGSGGSAGVCEGQGKATSRSRRLVRVCERSHPASEGIFPQCRARKCRALKSRSRVGLESKSDHTLPDDFFHDILDQQFTEEETVRQLETVINWGRYAELFDHDSERNGSRFPRRQPSLAGKRGSGDRNVSVSVGSVALPDSGSHLELLHGRDSLRHACSLLIYAVVAVARYWFSAPVAAVEISLSPCAIPRYAFYSLVRMIVAYVLSLVFAIGYGYFAAYNKRVGGEILAALTSGNPFLFLSFLPGVMLAMVSLFPSRQLGVEFGSILLIFTGQVWNMAFSFYASLKVAAARVDGSIARLPLRPHPAFLQLELPQGVIGLVWNSMVSVAGGWFFLMACEMFVLGKRDFRLPGLGSYLQLAASAGDSTAITWGIIAMIGVVILIDQLVWRPAIAWPEKFKLEK